MREARGSGYDFIELMDSKLRARQKRINRTQAVAAIAAFIWAAFLLWNYLQMD